MFRPAEQRGGVASTYDRREFVTRDRSCRGDTKWTLGERALLHVRQESKSGALFHQQMKSRESGHLLLKLVLKDNFVEVNLSRIATS